MAYMIAGKGSRFSKVYSSGQDANLRLACEPLTQRNSFETQQKAGKKTTYAVSWERSLNTAVVHTAVVLV